MTVLEHLLNGGSVRRLDTDSVAIFSAFQLRLENGSPHYVKNEEELEKEFDIILDKRDQIIMELKQTIATQHEHIEKLMAKKVEKASVRRKERVVLDDSEEKEIIKLFKTGKFLQKDLAEMFAVSKSKVCRILKNGTD